MKRGGGGKPDISPDLTIEVRLTSFERGVYKSERIMGGIVHSQYGPAQVDVSLTENTSEERRPVRLSLSFRTKAHPLGKVFAIEVTDMLEAAVQAHFEREPADRPLPPGPNPIG